MHATLAVQAPFDTRELVNVDPEKIADVAQDVADAITRLSMLAGAAASVLSDEQVHDVTGTLSAAGDALQDYQAASMPPVGESTKSGELQSGK